MSSVTFHTRCFRSARDSRARQGLCIFSNACRGLVFPQKSMNLAPADGFPSFFAGTSFSPQENSNDHSSVQISNSHSNPSKTSEAVSVCFPLRCHALLRLFSFCWVTKKKKRGGAKTGKSESLRFAPKNVTHSDVKYVLPSLMCSFTSLSLLSDATSSASY